MTNLQINRIKIKKKKVNLIHTIAFNKNVLLTLKLILILNFFYRNIIPSNKQIMIIIHKNKLLVYRHHR